MCIGLLHVQYIGLLHVQYIGLLHVQYIGLLHVQYIGLLHSKYRLVCLILTKIEFFLQVFGKSSNIKFHENPSSCIPAVLCGRTDGQT